MGWASGGDLFDQVIYAVSPYLVQEEKKTVFSELIDAFENFDCDVLYECQGIDPVLDNLLVMRHLLGYIEDGYISYDELAESIGDNIRHKTISQKDVEILWGAWFSNNPPVE